VKQFGEAPLRRTLFTLLLAACLLGAPVASAEDASVGRKIGNGAELVFDALILRPLGVAATTGGFGVFLITAPLLAPSREIAYGWDVFVLGPYTYTIERPFGEF